MKLNYLILFLFPVFSFGQTPRIAFLESDSILVQSNWYALLVEDIQAFGNFVRDSILEVETEKHTLRYRELMDEVLRYSCWDYDSKHEKEIEQEMQGRQENLKHLAKTADEFLSAYEDSLLLLWKEELLVVVDSLAVVWKYDFVLAKEAMVFLSVDNTKEQAMFEQAIIKVLNQKPSIKKWAPKIEALKKESLKNIRAAIYLFPVDVRKALSKLDVFRKVALWMHGAKLT
ncbi:MAG: hypothetical protein JKY03_14825 [Aureispira sp.]|nr:hypothetical protein [Aureispira sp.]